LFLARADADATLPGSSPIDLGSWAKDRYAQLNVLTEVPNEPIPISAPPELLAQLVDNLVDNAVKFGDPAHPAVVRITGTSDLAILEVEDHGPGVSDADLGRVFDPFFRSTDARKRGIPGVGLGLSVVKRIADALGARVSVQNQVRVGTVFRLEIPR